MSNVTYYLGAGASCNVLPLVKQIPDRLQDTISFLSRSDLRLDEDYLEDQSGSKTSIRECKDLLIDDLKWLKTESKRHATIDTFAKKLYIRSEQEKLLSLKSALIAFFTIEQFKERKVDPRYDTFFSSILDHTPRIPNNIKIVSWNYDIQLELALSEYSGTDRIDINAQNLLEVSKGQEHYKEDRFKYFKINGSSDYMDNLGRNVIWLDPPYSSESTLVKTVVKNHFYAKKSKFYPMLSFAWEDDLKINTKCIDISEAVVRDVSETDTLVVIGYSFPFFNRNIDREIIGGMKKLSKVYFQDPKAKSIKERFKSISPDIDTNNQILIEDNVEQFFLPNDL